MHASSNPRDCWCVAIGNSYDDEERCVLAGYDNGDIKLFDLRANKVRGEQQGGDCTATACRCVRQRLQLLLANSSLFTLLP